MPPRLDTFDWIATFFQQNSIQGCVELSKYAHVYIEIFSRNQTLYRFSANRWQMRSEWRARNTVHWYRDDQQHVLYPEQQIQVRRNKDTEQVKIPLTKIDDWRSEIGKKSYYDHKRVFKLPAYIIWIRRNNSARDMLLKQCNSLADIKTRNNFRLWSGGIAYVKKTESL